MDATTVMTVVSIVAVILIPVALRYGMSSARIKAISDFVSAAMTALSDGKITTDEYDKLIELGVKAFGAEVIASKHFETPSEK